MLSTGVCRWPLGNRLCITGQQLASKQARCLRCGLAAHDAVHASQHPGIRSEYSPCCPLGCVAGPYGRQSSTEMAAASERSARCLRCELALHDDVHALQHQGNLQTYMLTVLSTGVQRWPLGKMLFIKGANSLRASERARCLRCRLAPHDAMHALQHPGRSQTWVLTMCSIGIRHWPPGNRLRITGASSLRASAHAACAAGLQYMMPGTLCNLKAIYRPTCSPHCQLGCAAGPREQAAHKGRQQLASERARCLRSGLAPHDVVHALQHQQAIYRSESSLCCLLGCVAGP